MIVLAVIALFLAAIAGHAVARRLVPRVGAVAAFLIVGSIAGVGLMVGLWHASVERGEYAGAVLIYAGLCALYLFLFTLALGSITAHLLTALRCGARTEQELRAAYDGRMMVAARLDRLIAQELLVLKGADYALTARGRSLAGKFRKLAIFFGHEQ